MTTAAGGRSRFSRERPAFGFQQGEAVRSRLLVLRAGRGPRVTARTRTHTHNTCTWRTRVCKYTRTHITRAHMQTAHTCVQMHTHAYTHAHTRKRDLARWWTYSLVYCHNHSTVRMCIKSCIESPRCILHT